MNIYVKISNIEITKMPEKLYTSSYFRVKYLSFGTPYGRKLMRQFRRRQRALFTPTRTVVTRSYAKLLASEQRRKRRDHLRAQYRRQSLPWNRTVWTRSLVSLLKQDFDTAQSSFVESYSVSSGSPDVSLSVEFESFYSEGRYYVNNCTPFWFVRVLVVFRLLVSLKPGAWAWKKFFRPVCVQYSIRCFLV